jgi:hypothetical protein
MRLESLTSATGRTSASRAGSGRLRRGRRDARTGRVGGVRPRSPRHACFGGTASVSGSQADTRASVSAGGPTRPAGRPTAWRGVSVAGCRENRAICGFQTPSFLTETSRACSSLLTGSAHSERKRRDARGTICAGTGCRCGADCDCPGRSGSSGPPKPPPGCAVVIGTPAASTGRLRASPTRWRLSTGSACCRAASELAISAVAAVTSYSLQLLAAY